ncbi:MAG TPA: ATPase [Bacteroidales bacterium]|nr:ATPase [Bacteroidales bacterium]
MKKEIFKTLIRENQELVMAKALKPRQLKLPDVNKIISLIGPRRCGKTSLLHHRMQQLAKKSERQAVFYINFEDDRLHPLELNDLQYITEAYYELYPKMSKKRVYAFFDEVQVVKGWEKYIRRIYDTKNLRIFITGSSSSLLNRELATELRGRTLCYELFPLSFREYLAFLKINPDIYNPHSVGEIQNALNKYLYTGGFPEIVSFDEPLVRKTIHDYMQLMLYKDVVDRYDIKNHAAINHFMRHVFRNSAGLLSINKVFNDMKSIGLVLAKNSLYDYISYFEDVFACFTVPIHRKSINEQNRNPKKVYVADNSYYCSQLVVPEKSKQYENVVFNHLRRISNQIFYFKGVQETDFVYFHDGKKHLINVAYDISDASTLKREINGLKESMDAEGVKNALLINAVIEKEWKTEEGKIKAVPLWKWLLTYDDKV